MEDQILNAIEFHSRNNAMQKSTTYFQSYTNTSSSVHDLRNLYERILKFDEVIGITIGTCPDCINEEIICLLKETY